MSSSLFELFITIIFILLMLVWTRRLTIIKLLLLMLLHRVILALSRYYLFHVDLTIVLNRLLTPLTVIVVTLVIILWIRQQQLKNNGWFVKNDISSF